MTTPPTPPTPYSQTDLESLFAYVAGAVGDWTAVGQEAIRPRWNAMSTSGALTSGVLYLTYWTAYKNEPIAKVRLRSVNQRTGAATLMKVGTFSLHSKTKDLTLIGVSADFSGDGALNFPSTNTAYDISYTTVPTTVIGQRYATGILIVSANTMPTLGGNAATTSFSSNQQTPRMLGGVTAQADMPAIGGVITDASLAVSSLPVVQFVHLPA